MVVSGLYPRNRKFVDQSNPFTNKVFQDAVLRGDAAVISIMLKYGIVLRRNERNRHGLTALQQTVLDGNLKLAVRLMEHGADLESKTSNGWTCLHIAAATGDISMVHLLIVHCADVVALTRNEELPIDVAATTEVKYLLVQQLAKSGYAELAQWYTNKIANKDLVGSMNVNTTNVLEIACHSTSSLDLNMMPYCSHSTQSIATSTTLSKTNASEPNISSMAQTNGRQRKLSSYSLVQSVKTRDVGVRDDASRLQKKGCKHSPSYAMSRCGDCGHVYMQEVESSWATSPDLVCLSCSSGYLSETTHDNRPPSELYKHIEGSDVAHIDRKSSQSCSPQSDVFNFDGLRPVASNPVITTSLANRQLEEMRTLPRISRKPSCGTICSERRDSLSQHSRSDKKLSRVELFIDYYKDSIDCQLSEDGDNEDELGFFVGSDDNIEDDSLDEDCDFQSCSPDVNPSRPDKISTIQGLDKVRVVTVGVDGDHFPVEGQGTMQNETIQFLMDTMDRDIELPEQNMYFNPMYKSPPESSTDSQERLAREAYSNFAVSGVVRHDQNAWNNSRTSETSRRSSVSSREYRSKKKKGILSGLVSRLKDTVRFSRSSSDPELTDTEEPVTRRNNGEAMAIKRKRQVRRSNSFSSYFGSLFDQQQSESQNRGTESKENIDPACEYPEDYYFVDKSGQMVSKGASEVAFDADSLETNSPMRRQPRDQYRYSDQLNYFPGKSIEENILKEKTEKFVSSGQDNYQLEALVTPRLVRKDLYGTSNQSHDRKNDKMNFNGDHVDNDECWNLYPHTIVLNNGSLSPDTDDGDTALSSALQCSCRDCSELTNSTRGRTHATAARNTYQIRCHPVLNGVPSERGNTTTLTKSEYDAFYV